MTPLPNRPRLRTTRLALAMLAFGLLSSVAVADGKSAKTADGDFDGIEIGPKILNAIQHGEFIDDWSQAEIDAYYKVLDLARRVPYEQQTERARDNALKQLDEIERKADRDFEARKAEIERQADELGKIRATRARALAAQRHRKQLNDIDSFRENLAGFPMHKWVVTEMFTSLNDKRPSRYHGKLVTLRGHVRKLTSFEPYENPFGITTLYEAWLYPIGKERFEEDDPRTNPVVIVCLQIPEGMPTGDKIAEEATVTGYVFRLHAYRSKIPLKNSRGKMKRLLAPMILASRIEWKRPSPPPSAPLWLKAAILGGIAMIIIAVVIYARRDKAAHREFVRERLLEEGDEPRFPTA